MVKLLDVDAVVAIHDRALTDFGGGSPGILEIGNIEASVGRMSAGVAEKEFFPGLLDKAAALLESLVRNHGFVDGNKRTAVLATGALLELNGYHLSYGPEEVVEFALGVANREMELAEIVAWLHGHSRRA